MVSRTGYFSRDDLLQGMDQLNPHWYHIERQQKSCVRERRRNVLALVVIVILIFANEVNPKP